MTTKNYELQTAVKLIDSANNRDEATELLKVLKVSQLKEVANHYNAFVMHKTKANIIDAIINSTIGKKALMNLYK